MLRLHRSNRIEVLVDLVVARLRDDPLPDPLLPEVVAIGSRGLDEFLRWRTAEELGIAARLETPFPVAALMRVVGVLGGQRESFFEASGSPAWGGRDRDDPWDADRLPLGVLAALRGRLEAGDRRGRLDHLHRYLGAGRLEVVDAKAMRLGLEIGDRFDRYAVWRPEWAKAWAEDRVPLGKLDVPDELAWQPILFHDLATAAGAPNVPARVGAAQRLLEGVAAGSAGPEAEARLARLARDLPRIGFLGLAVMPAMHLDFLGALGKVMDVDLYLLSPSRAYWGDLARRRRDPSGAPAPEADGPPLLAASGALVRPMQDRIEELHPWEPDSEGLYRDPAEDSCGPGDPDADLPSERPPSALARLQKDLLDGLAPGRDGYAPSAPDPEDDSLAILGTTGPMRQAEVLRDALLGLLDRHPDLRPRDILVLSTDLARDAAHLEAVFGEGADRPDPGAPESPWGHAGGPRLPLRVVGRSLRDENPWARMVTLGLELAGSRLYADRVVELMGLAQVRRRFGLAPEEFDQITAWVEGAGIRWGRDAAHRIREGQPGDDAATWSAGLLRLALGATMPDEPGNRIADRVPFDPIEGEAATLAARMVTMVEACLHSLADLEAPRPVGEWIAALLGIEGDPARPGLLSALGVSDESDRALEAAVRGAIESLGPGAPADLPLDRQALGVLLESRLASSSRAPAGPLGGVVVSSLETQRSRPFPVVAIMGLDQGALPRQGGRSGLDLMEVNPSPGDPDLPSLDRWLFLEALLAARRHLVLVYRGTDPATGSPLPPCLPVLELMETIDRTFLASAGGERASRRWCLTLPPTPFSPRNFEPGRPWSHHLGWCEAARAAQAGGAPQAASAPLPPPTARSDGSPLGLAVLATDLADPPLAFARARLGLGEERVPEPLPRREPLDHDALSDWSLATSLLASGPDGPAVDHVAARFGERMLLSAGGPGRAVLEDQLARIRLARAVVSDLVAKIGTASAPVAARAPAGNRLEVRVPLGGGPVLVGPVTLAAPDLAVRLEVGRAKARRLVSGLVDLAAWTVAREGRPGLLALVLAEKPDQAAVIRMRVPGEDDERRREWAERLLADLARLRDECMTRPWQAPGEITLAIARATGLLAEAGSSTQLLGRSWLEGSPDPGFPREWLWRAAGDALAAWEGSPGSPVEGLADRDPRYPMLLVGERPWLADPDRDDEFHPDVMEILTRLWLPLGECLETPVATPRMPKPGGTP